MLRAVLRNEDFEGSEDFSESDTQDAECEEEPEAEPEPTRKRRKMGCEAPRCEEGS